MPRKLLIIVLAAIIGFLAPAEAYSDDIAAILSATSGDTEIRLTEDSLADNVVISGRSVTITSDGEEGKIIGNASASPLFAVVDGGHLTLELLSLQSQDDQPSDTLIYVENATLTLRNCVFATQRRFSVYMRGGTLETSNCDFLDSDTSVALTDGAQGSFNAVSFQNPVSGGLWITGQGSYAEVVGSEFTYGARGIAVDQGAQLLLESSGIYSSSEVGILADGAGVHLSDVWFEGVEGFGFYAQNNSGIAIENSAIFGPIGTGVTIINSATEVDGLEIVEAQNGITINGGNTPIVMRNIVASSTFPEAVHVIAEGPAVQIHDSSFEGGATGIGLISGALTLENSVVSGQTSSSVQVNGGEGVGPAVLSNVALVPEFEGLAVYGNSPFQLTGSQVVYEGSALGGDGLAQSDIANNLLFGPSDSAMSVHDAPRDINFANDFRSAENHRDLWQAVISSADVESRLRALDAVAAAFPLRSGDIENAVLSLFDTEIGGDLLYAGWTELGSLMRVVEGGDDQWLGDIRVDDLPISLPPGEYKLTDFRRTISLDLSAPGSELWLEFPDEVGPFAMYRIDGQPRRGPTFALRPQSELVRLLESSWPGYAQYNPPSVAIPNVTPEVRAAALSSAKQDIRFSLAFADSLPKGALYDDITQDQRTELTNHVYQHSAMARRILGAHGTAEDAAWLLEIAQPHLGLAAEFWARELVRTAAEIDARLGLLSTGATARMLDELGSDYNNPGFPSLAVAMANFGHAGALARLVDAVAVERDTEGWYTTDVFGAFTLIMHENVPEVTELALEFVDAYRGQALLNMTEGVNAPSTFEGVYIYSGIFHAYRHAAAFATGDDRQRLNVGVPQWNQMSEFGPVLAEPTELFEHLVAMDGPELRALRNSELAFMTCDLLMGQPAQPQAYNAIEDAMTDYGARYPDDIYYPNLWASNITSSGATHCMGLSKSMNNLETPSNREPSWFSNAWNFAFKPPSQTIAETTAASDTAVPWLPDIDSVPDFVLEPLLESATQTTGLQRYRTYATVATTAHTSQTGSFANGADTRVFLQPVEPFFEGYQLYWIAGTAKLAPIDLGDQTLFGLALDVDGTTFGGLAAMIARHPDVLALNLDNHGHAMVQDVVLRHGESGKTSMSYMKTLDSGVHVYSLPQTPQEQSNLAVDVHFATKGTEGQIMREWVISWPLYNSPYGFNKIRDTGRVTVKGADQ